MQRINQFALAAAVLAAVAVLPGCSLERKSRPGGKMPEASASVKAGPPSAPRERPRPAPEPGRIPQVRQAQAADAETSGTRVWFPSQSIAAGSKDGLDLDRVVAAVRMPDGARVRSASYSTPEHGVVKGFGGSSDIKYFPPATACSDSIVVKLTSTRGGIASGSLNIRVVSQKTAIVIDAPADGSRLEGHLCDISGSSVGVPAGQHLELVVEPAGDRQYVQECSPSIAADGRWNGYVYLGNPGPTGEGVGKRFRVIARTTGGQQCSNTVTVTRIR